MGTLILTVFKKNLVSISLADGEGGVRLPSQLFGIGPYEDNLYQIFLKKKSA